MSEAPYDRRKAIENFGGIEILKEASGVYLDEAQAQYEQLEAALVDQDYEKVRELSHLIKGGLVYLHAHPSAEAARRIELLSKSAPAENLEEMKKSLVTLKVELKALLEALREEF